MKRCENTVRSSVWIAVLLAAVLASCVNDTHAVPDGTQAPDTGTATETAETAEQDFRQKFPHEDIDFDGKVFSVISDEDYTGNGLRYDDLSLEAPDGDILNDAVFQRNSEVSERFNLKFSVDSRDDGAAVMVKAVTAGDPTYDAAAIRFTEAYSKSLYCMDLLSLENLSVSASWWDQNSVRDLSIAGVLRMITGDIFYRHYDGVQVLLFNKSIAEQYDIENLYQCVTDGRWTVDKMGEVCRLTTKELDGNGKMDRYDQWGYASQNNDYLPALINACGMRMIQKDGDDIPYCSVDIEKTTALLEKYGSYYKDCTFDIGRDAHYENLCAFWVFPEGRSLLYWSAVHYIPWKLRDIEFDFGILPIPKYDEAQTEYISALTPYHSYCYMIPKSAGDPEQSAYIMDALGFYGENLIKDVYYDSCLKRKYSNDQDSFAMLDLIFGNIVYDLGAYADFGGFCNSFSTTFTDKSAVNLASVFAKREPNIKKDIETFVTAALEDLDNT